MLLPHVPNGIFGQCAVGKQSCYKQELRCVATDEFSDVPSCETIFFWNCDYRNKTSLEKTGLTFAIFFSVATIP